MSDADGNLESRTGTISVFNGAPPTVVVCGSSDAEQRTVAEWLAERVKEGVKPGEIGVFARSGAELARALAAVAAAGLKSTVLDDTVRAGRDTVSVGTMHLSKGLEFRSVVVMCCDDEVLPLQARIESVTDDGDLADVYETERHLLYVACTRARDHLLVSAVEPASEFLDDLRG